MSKQEALLETHLVNRHTFMAKTAAIGMGLASLVGIINHSSEGNVAEAALDNRVAAGQTDCVQVGNPGDIALTNSAIAEPEQPGFATVGPTGYDWRAYSSNNYPAGGATSNLTAIKIGPDGKLCTTAQQRAHKILDLIGFIDGDAFTAYNNSPVPTRIMDTRGNPVLPDNNGLNLINSFNSSYINDDQIETRCVTKNPSPGFYYMQVFYTINNLSNNPTIGPGGYVYYDFDFHTGLFSNSGPKYPDAAGKIVIESLFAGLRVEDTGSWKGTTTFSNYNSGNKNQPIQNVPTSIFATDIPCPLVP